MRSASHSIRYGTKVIDFNLERRARKTLAIHVHPDKTVEVIAPENVPLQKVYAKVRQRAGWVINQLQYFEQFYPKTPERQYVPGETHRYLGRQYRLKVEPHHKAGVKLIRGFITVQTQHPNHPQVTRKLVEEWLFERAKQKFHERVEHCLRLFPDPEVVRPVGTIVRQLSNRWGSMTPAGHLVLNRRLIQAPVPCIDYVIVHELCHRVHAHHGPDFWILLDQIFPDWQKFKNQLELVMI